MVSEVQQYDENTTTQTMHSLDEIHKAIKLLPTLGLETEITPREAAKALMVKIQ